MGSGFTPKHKRLIFEICILGRFSKDSVNFEASPNMFVHLFISPFLRQDVSSPRCTEAFSSSVGLNRAFYERVSDEV